MASVARFDTWQAADGTNVARFTTGELEVWDGAAWGPAGGLQFATISTTATGSYTDGGISYDYWDFTSNGSLVISEGGLVDVLVVGAGGGRSVTGSNNAYGGGGGVRYGIFEVTAGTVAVTIGAGGAGAGGGSYGGQGTSSTFGSHLFAGGGNPGFANNTVVNASRTPVGGGGQPGAIKMAGSGLGWGAGARGLEDGGSNSYDGITLNYNNSSIEYGRGGGFAAATNSGGGGDGANGADGRVVVRVRT